MIDSKFVILYSSHNTLQHLTLLYIYKLINEVTSTERLLELDPSISPWNPPVKMCEQGNDE